MKTAIVIAGTAAVLALTGCSSSSSDTTSSPSPAATSAAATTAAASPQASMIGPIVVEPDQTEVEATVGRFIDFQVGDSPQNWKIETDNAEVLKVTPGRKEGDTYFNPGAEALAVGTATVTLTDTKSDMDAMEYTVTVTE